MTLLNTDVTTQHEQSIFAVKEKIRRFT